MRGMKSAATRFKNSELLKAAALLHDCACDYENHVCVRLRKQPNDDDDDTCGHRQSRLQLLLGLKHAWAGLLAWLALTSVKYHDNPLILMPLNQWLALTMLRTTGPWSITYIYVTGQIEFPVKFTHFKFSLFPNPYYE